MPVQGQADEVDIPRTEELAEQTTEPSEDEGSGEATGDASLDYDVLLGRKDPNNKRGGLSRKEARILKEDSDEYDEPAVLEKALAEIRELKELVQSNQGNVEQSNAEQKFSRALKSAGVDVSTFNVQFKDAYLENFNSLLTDGLSTEKASQYALNMVLPRVEAMEAENRSNGRMRAQLPPTGQTQSKTIYKQSEIEKLATTDRARYKALMNDREKGRISVV